ncbi:uncharacterized protein H6S33_002421 [Morchella sextelata]|uniref:uncharacterized protein n=1 Tax=Morchella sextelata TaxID=1174677 RepID=UPI001D052E8F|nr:uncharacterized protein H6S33_002421 [Morchella sextelata]KAH0607387.1 hypothetical protein H6S33_002421 [Morchella sextelata]
MPSPLTMSTTTTTITTTTTTKTRGTTTPHPSNLDQFLAAPTPFLARVLYNSLPAQRRQPPEQHGEEALTVVCVSDTHGQMPPLPAGDLLLHSGDLTASGTMGELQDALQWIASQPHRYKVVIAGNRELCLDEESRGRPLSISNGSGAQDEKASITSSSTTSTTTTTTTTTATIDWEKLSAAGLVYLQNSSITLHFPAPRDRCIKIFGSPLSPRHSPHAAFQYASAEEQPWHGMIPPDTDIVLTHTPPQCHLDSWRRLGCGVLLRELWRVRPALHVFGHVHAGYGVEVVRWDEMQRLYEGACAGGGGSGGSAWALVRMAGMFVVCWVSYGLFGGRWRWGDDQGETRMVNASASRGRGGGGGGGEAGDSLLVNEPIVVRL